MLETDLPITKSEDDILNRRTFAQSLAKTMLYNSFPSSFTIGLYGEWGSGKTSLINMVLEYVEAEKQDKSVIVFRFNPWLCSDSNQLVTQFFKQLATAIKLEQPAKDKLWKLVDQYADIFDVADSIPVAGSVFSVIGKVLSKKAKKAKLQTDNLQYSKNQIVKKLEEIKCKIIVAIDDIDRLSEEEIIAVFQLIKAIADFPDTVYLLAFDYKVVVNALGKVQNGDGKQYLEKIVQVPFEIPAPDLSSIYRVLFSELSPIIENISEECFADLYRFGFRKYIKTLRDVARYTNLFTLKYELLKEETDMADLLCLTVLQVFEPYIFSKLTNYKDILCSHEYVYSNDLQKEKAKNALSSILTDDGTVTDSEAAKNLLGLLFPSIRAIDGTLGNIGRSYSYVNSIASYKCFDRYFTLTLEEDAVPTAIVENLIFESTENEFDDGVMKLYEQGKIVRLLEEIDAYARKERSTTITAERAQLIITVLARNWNSFEVDDRGFLAVPFAWRIIYIADPLLKAMNQQSRFVYIKTLFSDSEIQVSTLSLLLHDFENQLGRFTENGTSQNDATFSLEEVLELEGIFEKRAKDAVASGSALNQRNGLNFLWMLEQIDAEFVADTKKSLASKDDSLVKVISYCTSCGLIGARNSKKTRNFNRETLESFINADEAYQRMKRLSTTNQFWLLSEDDQINAMAFILVTERKSPETILENAVTEDEILEKLSQMKKQYSAGLQE